MQVELAHQVDHEIGRLLDDPAYLGNFVQELIHPHLFPDVWRCPTGVWMFPQSARFGRRRVHAKLGVQLSTE